jgi:hypothetical protein
VRIVSVPRDEAVFRPANNSRFMDVEASGRFRCRQHAAVAKPLVAGAKGVSMDEIGDAQCFVIPSIGSLISVASSMM